MDKLTALEHAQWLEKSLTIGAAEAGSELRRLHAENLQLRESLKKANSQAEHFEREWYLRGDRIEVLERELNRGVEGSKDPDPILCAESPSGTAEAVGKVSTGFVSAHGDWRQELILNKKEFLKSGTLVYTGAPCASRGEPIGYIHKDDLEKLLSNNAGNHLTVGLDTRQAWPSGVGESNPYDWLVAVYTGPPKDAVAEFWDAGKRGKK